MNLSCVALRVIGNGIPLATTEGVVRIHSFRPALWEAAVVSTPELDRIRSIALALPEVNERLSHGAPSFFFRDKRPICYFHGSDFASDERVSIWCPAPPGGQELLIATDPLVFFAPTPSSSGVFRDWIGVFLDEKNGSTVDWDDVADVVEDAFRLVAPKKLITKLEGRKAKDQ